MLKMKGLALILNSGMSLQDSLKPTQQDVCKQCSHFDLFLTWSCLL